MTIRFIGLPTDHVRALQAGAPDANGRVPEHAVADGNGEPCRHCLHMMEAGEDYLVLANRPFETVQPYAEVGPIFLHARGCPAFDGDGLPPVLEDSPDYIIRGYGADERIVYGTGGVIAREAMVARAEAILAMDGVAFAHVRSSRNNCWQARVEGV